MDVSPYILKFKFFLKKYLFYNDCLDSCWSVIVKKRNDLPKKVCLIIIHRNTTHILNMSYCHKHQ